MTPRSRAWMQLMAVRYERELNESADRMVADRVARWCHERDQLVNRVHAIDADIVQLIALWAR